MSLTWNAAVSDAQTNLTSVQAAQRVTGVDTSELRWFADGGLPPGLAAWFTRDGATGEREERCDIYRLIGRRDIGVKLRARRVLELKIRQSVGERLTVGAGLTGQVEAWRKWSPADILVERNDDLAWVDVHKTVIKRRFSVDGDEVIRSEDAGPLTSGGVDVEIVALTVERAEAWTFAFSAFGPTGSRHSSIVNASLALFAGTWAPELGFLSSESSSYPNWLAHVELPRPTSQSPSRPD